MRHERFLSVSLAVILFGSCGVGTIEGANETEPSAIPQMASTRADPSVRGTGDCRTADQPKLRALCGTADVAMEFVPDAGMNSRKRLALGERAEEASSHLRAVNGHIANVREARPELVASLLRAAEPDIRSRALRICELEGRNVPSRLAVRSELLRAYVWTAYRLALIDKDPGGYLRRVDSLLAHPCFHEEAGLYFNPRPAAFSSPGDFLYSLSGFFAGALSYYHRHKNEPRASDAYAFRSEIDTAGHSRSACLGRVFQAEASSLAGMKGKLWDRCLQLIARGGSCMEHQKECAS